jgi:flagellin
VAFSINTNVSSLEAQYYLNQTNNFQSKTINEVTSGLRIVNAGDDAAGLAVANGYRSDEAVLNQGIQNLTTGISTLQTIDGGMTNIGNLLDRARTLATESASGTFTGDRNTLNSEYQNVMQEINRQAQSTGVNTGGDFAKQLQVFVGGGRGTTAAGVLANGSVTADLSQATVDTQSLGLNGYQVNGGNAATLGNTGSLFLTNIAATTNPTAAITFSGAGFDSSTGTNAPVAVTVNLNGVTDAASLVTAINNGIAQAANGTAAGAAAFKAAGISASLITNSTTGVQSIAFTSANGAFSATGVGATAANIDTANAFGAAILGSAYVAATATAAKTLVSGGTYQSGEGAFTGLGQTTTNVNNELQDFTFQAADANGNMQTLSITLSHDAAATGTTTAAGADYTTYAGDTFAHMLASINKALQGSSSSVLNNIVAYEDNSTGTPQIGFTSTSAFTATVGALYQDNLSGNGAGTLGADGFTGSALSPTSTTAGTIGVGSNQVNVLTGATSSLDISTAAGAAAAVTALGTATQNLGMAQAAVGKGENIFNYALNLASTQVTNEAASESSIRDADLASQAANLSKAQIMEQAGVAALAQANSAPQAILALLKT